MRRNTKLIWFAVIVVGVALMGFHSGETLEPPPENPCEKQEVTL